MKRTDLPRPARMGVLNMTVDTAAAILKGEDIIFFKMSVEELILLLEMNWLILSDDGTLLWGRDPYRHHRKDIQGGNSTAFSTKTPSNRFSMHCGMAGKCPRSLHGLKIPIRGLRHSTNIECCSGIHTMHVCTSV